LQEFSNGIIARLARSLLNSASRVIALSEAEADALIRIAPGIRVAVISNAVDTRRFPDVERKWGDKKMVFLGRLDKAKGLDDIVEACRALVGQGFKFTFTCFGVGPDRQTFLSAMSEVLGDRFHYGGVVIGEDKIRALSDADMLLLPSKFEGLPLALLEAMAAGCVPVVSDRGSIASVVEDGRNGFLIQPGDLMQILGKLKFR
jgi:glycosyltransferase involved in cell wall biosynthesis